MVAASAERAPTRGANRLGKRARADPRFHTSLFAVVTLLCCLLDSFQSHTVSYTKAAPLIGGNAGRIFLAIT